MLVTGSVIFLPPPGLLLLGYMVFALLCRHWRLIIVIKKLLPMRLPIRVYFFHKFLSIAPGRRRNLDFDLFLSIGLVFSMSAINKYHFEGKVSRLLNRLQNPYKYLIYRLFCRVVLEVITHHREMGRFFLQQVSHKMR